MWNSTDDWRNVCGRSFGIQGFLRAVCCVSGRRNPEYYSQCQRPCITNERQRQDTNHAQRGARPFAFLQRVVVDRVLCAPKRLRLAHHQYRHTNRPSVGDGNARHGQGAMASSAVSHEVARRPLVQSPEALHTDTRMSGAHRHKMGFQFSVRARLLCRNGLSNLGLVPVGRNR
jgi:hypothetical protein